MGKSVSPSLSPKYIMDKRQRIITTVVYYTAFIALGMCLAVIGPTLPSLADKLKVSLGALGVIFVAREAGIILMASGGGRLYDRLPGHVIFAVGLLASAILLALVPLAPSLPVLFVIFCLMGFCLGAVDIGGNTLLMVLHGESVAPFMNGLHFFFGVGTSIAPIIVAQVMQSNGGDSRWAYWILAMLILPVIFIVLRQPSPTHQHRVDDSMQKNQKDYWLILAFAVFTMMFVGAEASFGGWISSYLVVLGKGTQAAAAYLASGYWGGFTLGRLAGIPIAMRMSVQRILFGSMVLALIFLVIMIAFPGSLTAIWIGTCGFGFAIGPLFATTLALAGKRMRLTGQITGWIMLGGSAGALVLPGLIGQVMSVVGAQGFIYVITAAMALALVMLVVILSVKSSKQVISEETVTQTPSPLV